jgi:hypothetical protein
LARDGRRFPVDQLGHVHGHQHDDGLWRDLRAELPLGPVPGRPTDGPLHQLRRRERRRRNAQKVQQQIRAQRHRHFRVQRDQTDVRVGLQEGVRRRRLFPGRLGRRERDARAVQDELGALAQPRRLGLLPVAGARGILLPDRRRHRGRFSLARHFGRRQTEQQISRHIPRHHHRTRSRPAGHRTDVAVPGHRRGFVADRGKKVRGRTQEVRAQGVQGEFRGADEGPGNGVAALQHRVRSVHR